MQVFLDFPPKRFGNINYFPYFCIQIRNLKQLFMRKLLLLFTLFISLTIGAQEKQSIVKLKNGTVLKGVIRSIDPTDVVVIRIAGVETRLKFDSISSIEEITHTDTVTRNDTVRIETNVKKKKGLRYKKYYDKEGDEFRVYEDGSIVFMLD